MSLAQELVETGVAPDLESAQAEIRQARRDFFKARPSGFPDMGDLEDFFNNRWGFSPDYAPEAINEH